MRVMALRVSVYVPSNRIDKTMTQVAALTAACGGSSTTPVHGAWIGDDGRHHVESVNKVEAWYGGHQLREVESAVKDLIAALIVAGEECVMVEWLTSHGLSAELHTIKDTED